MAALTAPIAVYERSRFFGAVAVAPAVLLLGHLFPASGPGLALRLAGAAACVLLVPGALVVRAVGWPSSLGVALAASFVLSLALVAVALAFVFLVNGSILVAAGVIAAVSVCVAVPAALKGRSTSVARAERRAVGAVCAAAVPFAAVVWWATGPMVGDTYFHLGRVTKLADLDSLNTLSTVDEFRDGGLHPGYAFPLLHGAEALIARVGGAAPADVILYLPAILVPLAFVLAYASGSAIFRSPAGGVALVLAQAALSGFSRRDMFFEGTGLFETLSQPQAASRLLVTPALVALAFTYMVEGGWILLASLGAAGLTLAALHPTYVPYVAIVLGGFLVARVVLVRGWEPLLTRAAVALAAILVPFGFLLIFLLPIARQVRGVTPAAGARSGELHQNAGNFTVLGDWFGYAPGALARAGPVVVAGLLAVPLAAFAARRLWSALVLGGSLAVLTVLLAPPLFTALSDVVSVSQSRRLAGFVPLAFAVAGGCVVLSRWRAVGVAFGAGAGLALVLLYPGEFTRRAEEGGPAWAVFVALAGALGGLLAGSRLRSRGPAASGWAVAIAVAFVVPVAVAGLSEIRRVRPVTDLTPGVIAALQAQAAPGDVVFSDPKSALEAGAFAPVYVNASPIGNVADTKANRPRLRVADARRFFQNRGLSDSERRAILGGYGADWLLVDDHGPRPRAFLRTLPRVFEDGRYSLYRVSP